MSSILDTKDYDVGEKDDDGNLLEDINWMDNYIDESNPLYFLFSQNNPFKDSGLALYNWSPIADELKVLDKEIVLNSIKLKWNLVENEFKDLTKNLTFN